MYTKCLHVWGRTASLFVQLVNAHRETICSCWLLNRRHCVFCSLIKFHMTLPVGMLSGRDRGARLRPDDCHRGMTSAESENSLTETFERRFMMLSWLQKRRLISTGRCLYAEISVILFWGTLTFILYFKHMSPAPRVCLRLRWKAKFCLFFFFFVIWFTFNGRTNL